MKQAALVCLLLLVVFGVQPANAAAWRSRVWPETPEGITKPHADVTEPDPDPDVPLALQGWIIVLDPGHGGSDPGAVNSRLDLQEKNINLAVAGFLKGMLQDLGANVKMTRTADEELSIAERRNYSNAQNAHRFLSLHVNSAGNTAAWGIETWVDTDANQIWKDYAQTLHNYTVAKAKTYDSDTPDRKLRYSGFTPPCDGGKKIVVIRYDSINAPAALIEMGFISNDAEANRLARSDYQKLLAEGMAEGFVEHAKQYKKEDGVIKR